MPEVLDRHRWLAPTLVYGAILVATLAPISTSSSSLDWLSVTFHVGAYAILATAWLWAFPRWSPSAIVVVCVAMGLANEVAQLVFTNDRAFQMSDIAADAAGAAIATGIWTLRSS